MYCTSPTTVTARFVHRCTWCCENIMPGEKYLRWASVDDSWATNKMHPECLQFLQDEHGYSFFEFTPGDGAGHRPTTK